MVFRSVEPRAGELPELPRLTVSGTDGGEFCPDPKDGVRARSCGTGAGTVLAGKPREWGGDRGEEGRAYEFLGDVLGDLGDPERRWLGSPWDVEVA